MSDRMGSDRAPNRLIHEKSPYLLQHAHNPVDWYPWSEEAFARARAEQRPIFLSIGYSTCHWCHVMERESFENPEIAELMNRGFVNVKVDREERPDVDRVYMTFVQATTGSGGWPLSVFLTPELEPIVGGTYFAPFGRQGQPGFIQLLQHMSLAWEKQRDQIRKAATEILEQLRAAVARPDEPEMLDTETVFRGFKAFQGLYDRHNGGFGRAPKFPRPVAHNFLLRYFARTGDEEAARMVLATLRKMADGGIHDHLAGGFHRYSVDGEWHVPHFEKMLYDQALLARSYVEGYQLSRDERLADVARATLDYVLRDLTDPETGAFYSAEDADSLIATGGTEKAEGAFYVWTEAELREALGPRAEAFCRHYGVRADGNAYDPHGELVGQNVLHVVQSLDETARQVGRTALEVAALLEEARAILRERRALRPRPHLDDKVLCAWNGMMISALAHAAVVLDEPRYLAAAQRAARFLTTTLCDCAGPTCYRRYRAGERAVEGYLEDYVHLTEGLLDLYQADFDLAWLLLAERLTEHQLDLFSAPEEQGFYSTKGDDPSVLLRVKEDYDGAEPSPNSIAAQNLLRLGQLLDRPEWRQRAEHTVRAFSARLNEVPEVMPQMLVASDEMRHPAVHVVLTGERGDPRLLTLLEAVHRGFLPHKLVFLADEGAKRELGPRLPFILPMTLDDGRPTAYVCLEQRCERPTSDAGDLLVLLGARTLTA